MIKLEHDAHMLLFVVSLTFICILKGINDAGAIHWKYVVQWFAASEKNATNYPT